MSDNFSVKSLQVGGGKEIQNPVVRVLIAVLVLAIIAIVLSIVAGTLLSVFGIFVGAAVFVALLVVPHFILRILGRQGFFKESHDETTNKNSLDINISSDAFRRVQ